MYSKYSPEGASVDNRLVGLYYTYASLWGYSTSRLLSCFQIGTDVASAGDVEGVETPFYQYAQLTDENAGVSWLWEKCYEFINEANQIIEMLGKTVIRQRLQKQSFSGHMLIIH